MEETTVLSAAKTMKLVGMVSLNNLIQLRSQGEEIINQIEAQTIKLDLAEMKSASSFSLSLLLCWIRYATKQNKTIEIINLPSSLANLASLYNLKGIL